MSRRPPFSDLFEPSLSTSHIIVSIQDQRLALFDGQSLIRQYVVSTAKNGAGEQNGSGCTPRGQHIIRAKIGAGCDIGTVFVARRSTGEIHTPALAQAFPERDWILTRIMWLSGCEPGKNRLGCVDTMRRYIYIHGCPDTEPMGTPLSHGCIRMRNADIAQLFDLVDVGTTVEISEEPDCLFPATATPGFIRQEKEAD